MNKTYQYPSTMSTAYVGYGNPNQCGYRYLFTEENICNVQAEVTKQLQCILKKNIVVVKEQIIQLLSTLLENNSPIIGDIYTRFIIPSPEPRNDVLSINEQAVNIMVAQISEEYRMKAYNESLTIWTTNYGDFNKHGLRRHDIIKVKQNDVKRGQFNMRY